MNKKIYDVAICGAGLAGLTLARQLKLKIPNLAIAVLDRMGRPLPEATHKVGESTVSVGTYYLANVLGLQDYLNQYHFPKLGVRFFFGKTKVPFHKRSEFGQSEFFQCSFPYQIDRGRFENDLRQFNVEAGVEIRENCSLKKIELSQSSEIPHEITYSQGSQQTSSLQAHWVIDAMGRRRFLQKQLNLAKPNNPKYSAAWFRIEDRIDISNFVSNEQRKWHDRVPNRNRYYSTNNLCGEGYWVWLIPLSSGYTSIGIVTDEDLHPFEEYHTYERAYQWLKKHESVLAAHLQGKQPADFMKMPRYSYSSERVFSIDRWACAGDAGVFAEPLNSSGLQLCAIGNSLITQAIARDIKGQLTSHFVEEANCFFLKLNDNMAWRFQNYYACFRNEVSTALKYVWDVMVTWAFSSPLMFNDILLDPDKRRILHQYQEKFAPLEKRVQQLFLDWSAQSLQRVTYDYIDYTEIAFLKKHRGRNFASHPTEEELIASQIANLEAFEEFAQAIFLIAVADTLPEQLPRASATGWLNAWAIGLKPEQWEAEGLFSPSTQPRNIAHITEPLDRILQTKEAIFKNFTDREKNSLATADNSFTQTCLKVPTGSL